MVIDAGLLQHPSDKAALQALKAIPGFSQLVRAYMGAVNERQLRIVNMSGSVRLGQDQMPEYYRMLPPICEKLGIAVPELYLEMNVVPNAYTYGDTQPFIVLTSGLLDILPDELIPTVLAHECGHIACRHPLYTTMGSMVLNGIDQLITGLAGLLTAPMRIAFAYWMRCSEYSADRAAVVCDGGPEKMMEVCFRLAGNIRENRAQCSMDAFLRQAEEYRRMTDESKWNHALEFMLLAGRTHPLTAVRALECREWGASPQFARIGALLRRLPGAPAEGEVPAPESSEGCVRRQKDDLADLFTAAGFSNLRFVRTTERGSASRDGEVVSALVDGVRAFGKDEWLPGGAALVFVYYEKETAAEFAGVHKSQVLLTGGASAYIGRRYQDVVFEFRMLGFTDVREEAVPRRLGLMAKEGTVTRVTVGGDAQFRQNRWVPEDAPVRVYYAAPPAGR